MHFNTLSCPCVFYGSQNCWNEDCNISCIKMMYVHYSIGTRLLHLLMWPAVGIAAISRVAVALWFSFVSRNICWLCL
ncbi:hypothetical protein XELAEV_18042092mg [Xenopus laevis]|uniref:Uncharacterized protein n=1 Tax=Xenopus laevis TaxID=8355 RepID=A0A974C3E8_XENLA|nr:hypothetical protein XELAEV_18042092mg [Xenopus laevis]